MTAIPFANVPQSPPFNAYSGHAIYYANTLKMVINKKREDYNILLTPDAIIAFKDTTPIRAFEFTGPKSPDRFETNADAAATATLAANNTKATQFLIIGTPQEAYDYILMGDDIHNFVSVFQKVLANKGCSGKYKSSAVGKPGEAYRMTMAIDADPNIAAKLKAIPKKEDVTNNKKHRNRDDAGSAVSGVSATGRKSPSKEMMKDKRNIATLAVKDLSTEIATLPGTPSSASLTAIDDENALKLFPSLAEGVVYYVCTVSTATDPTSKSSRDAKIPSTLVLTRLNLFLLDNTSKTVSRCIPLTDITHAMAKRTMTVVKTKPSSSDHDLFVDLPDTDAVAKFQSVLKDCVKAAGGADVDTSELTEIKSHIFAPKEGYELKSAGLPMKITSAVATPKTPATPKPPTPVSTPQTVQEAPKENEKAKEKEREVEPVPVASKPTSPPPPQAPTIVVEQPSDALLPQQSPQQSLLGVTQHAPAASASVSRRSSYHTPTQPVAPSALPLPTSTGAVSAVPSSYGVQPLDSTSKDNQKNITSKHHSSPHYSIRPRLEAFIKQYFPEKLPQLDDMLRNNKGREEQFMAELAAVWGPEPLGPAAAGVDPNDPQLQRLVRFYRKYDPSKIATAPYILRDYEGHPDSLFKNLEFVFGPEPPEGANDYDSTSGAATSVVLAAANKQQHSGLPYSPDPSYGVPIDRPRGLVALSFPFTQPAEASVRTTGISKAPTNLTPMMPSLSFAAVLWAGHVAYYDFSNYNNSSNNNNSPNRTSDSPNYNHSSVERGRRAPVIKVRVGILTTTHFYIGADFHYDRCIPVAHLTEGIYLRGKLRAHSTHLRILAIIKGKAPEHDCCFEFASEQEAVRMVSIAMRLVLDIDRHKELKTYPFDDYNEPQFALRPPQGYAPRVVPPLPLLPEYEPLLGRYRQRLITIYQQRAIDKLENVDRILYMFPHEEEKMIAKLEETYGIVDDDDVDASDIIGIALNKQRKTQLASFEVTGTLVTTSSPNAANNLTSNVNSPFWNSSQYASNTSQLRNAALPSFIEKPDDYTSPPRIPTIYEPAKTNNNNNITNNGLLGPSPSNNKVSQQQYAQYTVASSTSPTQQYNSTPHGTYDPNNLNAIPAMSSSQMNIHYSSSTGGAGHTTVFTSGTTVGDLLRAQGFSIQMFERAARDGTGYRGVSAHSGETHHLRSVQEALQQCGGDESAFLDKVRSRQDGYQSPQWRDGASHQNNTSRYGTIEPIVESSPSAAVSGRNTQPHVSFITTRHPLWPYL